MFKDLRRQYPLRVLCRMLEVSRSGYHAWLRREPSERACSRERTQAGCSSRAHPHACHPLAVGPNLLAQDIRATRPDEVWAADITYVPTEEGWLYVVAIKDLFAGEIVGRNFGQGTATELQVRAFGQAVSARRPSPGLIHHSDRGSQYCSHEHQGLLVSHVMRVPVGRKGNCYKRRDHRELLGHSQDRVGASPLVSNRSEAAREITEYIDLFYIRQRRQTRLGHLSPVAHTQLFTWQRASA